MRHPAWWLVAAMLAGTAWALDPPDPAPAPATAPEPAPAGEELPAGEETAPVEEESPAAPPEARSTGPTPQRFDPSEKVRADFPVSFPIDI